MTANLAPAMIYRQTSGYDWQEIQKLSELEVPRVRGNMMRRSKSGGLIGFLVPSKKALTPNLNFGFTFGLLLLASFKQ